MSQATGHTGRSRLDLRLHPKPPKDYWESLGEAGSFLPAGSNSGTEEGVAAGPTQTARTSYQPGAPSPRGQHWAVRTCNLLQGTGGVKGRAHSLPPSETSLWCSLHSRVPHVVRLR